MIKTIFLPLILVIAFTGVHGQSLAIDELLKLTSMDYSNAQVYLTKSKGFKKTSSTTVYGCTIEQYAKTEEFLIKSDFIGENKALIPSLHYENRYSRDWGDTLVKQLQQLHFKCTQKEQDVYKKHMVFKNDKYQVIVYFFKSKALPWEIEVRCL